MKKLSDFYVRCRLTCFGGSENGECSCRNPTECEMQNDPRFPAMRSDAIDRMYRVVGAPPSEPKN